MGWNVVATRTESWLAAIGIYFKDVLERFSFQMYLHKLANLAILFYFEVRQCRCCCGATFKS